MIDHFMGHDTDLNTLILLIDFISMVRAFNFGSTLNKFLNAQYNNVNYRHRVI